MKKIFTISIIFFLIIATSLTKNNTKKLDDQIFNLREDLRILNNKYELVLLDFNFLSSPKKLLEYKKIFFEDLIYLDIQNFKKIFFNENKIKIEEITKLEIDNEKNW